MTWAEARARLASYPGGTCYGVHRGGHYIAAMLGTAVDNAEEADCIVDDIVDTGTTRRIWLARYPDKNFWALVNKVDNLSDTFLPWIVFPWEVENAEDS